MSVRFKARTNKEIRRGSVIDQIYAGVSEEIEDAYIEIENNKNPHIYTSLDTVGLERTGFFVNVPRNKNESDHDYLHRIMNWTYLKAAANLTAINDSLLNMENASDAQYYAGIYGAGTGIVYIIPKEYTSDVINAAVKEAKERLKNVIDPGAYVEYMVPEIKPVKFIIQISSELGDIEYLKQNAEQMIHDYVNAIPPKEYFSIGKINKIGNDINNMDYFNVIMTYINEESKTDIRFLQDLDTKYLLDEIIWEIIK